MFSERDGIQDVIDDDSKDKEYQKTQEPELKQDPVLDGT